MSAHCNDCGTDLVYGAGEDWQVMTCPVCTLRAECEDLAKANQGLREEVERRAAENARLQDGVIQMVNALWSIYEQAQSVARKPSPA